MTYRIITNGSKFRVQRRAFFGVWLTEGVHTYVAFLPHEFSVLSQADDYIREKQLSAARASSHRPPRWAVVR